MSEPPNDRVMLAIFLRVTSVFAFAIMGAMIKLAEAGGAHLAETMFFRQLFALVPVTLWISAGPGLSSIRTRRIGAHILRTGLGLVSMSFVFGTILLLPLAESTTLQFTLPIWATILGAVLLSERVGWHRWGAVIMGFVGVLIITQPGAGMAGWGIATGLIGALLSAGVSILLRQIGKTEGAATTVFWFSALSVPPTAIAFAITASPHPAQTWLLLALVGMCGGIAQMLMTASLKLGPVSLVVPMDYTGLVWATLFGWVLFDVLPGWSTWLGAPFVIGSGLYIVWREHVRRRGETTQAIA
ncbi:MAG: DMT family transporter [Sphingomonas sp.]|uniref:DMT family transporter n=1 Tax=Sphingomonas sp. TaxID=28214 RepID=UPI001825E03F|nr:EamA family transporter [Zymomonas sp.]MBA4771621.1 DMT family transporter [Sphingomonas sp.]